MAWFSSACKYLCGLPMTAYGIIGLVILVICMKAAVTMEPSRSK